MVLKTRRAARAVTRRYNQLLRPFDLQCTQVSLLYAVAAGGFDSISEMADQQAMERSTLTRNLQLLRKRGLICSEQEGQGRPQRFELTPQGAHLLEVTIPLWQQAQDTLRQEWGEEDWSVIQSSLSIVGAIR